MADSTLWNSRLLAGLVKPATQKWDRLKTFANQADDIAEQHFPNSARDASDKNAFRHALGTGMLTQELGGGPMAATMAKMAGYGWEALGAKQFLNDSKYREDTRHDLNANNIGASVATQVKNEAELIARLKQLANASVTSVPPGVLERGVPHMTRTVR